MSKKKNERLSQTELEEVRQAFTKFDINNDGSINSKELAKVLKSMGQNPTPKDIRKFMDALDTDRSGTIEFGEFAVLWREKLRKDQRMMEAKDAFKAFDKDGSGVISAKELHEVMAECGEELSPAEIDDIMKEADVGNDGYLDFKEFLKLLDSLE